MGNCIKCPFHGWQFRGEDGKCTRIPYAGKVPDVARVRTWPSCEVNGMLLVWYHWEGVGPRWAAPEQQEIATKEWAFRGQTEHLVDAHTQAKCQLEPEPSEHCSWLLVQHIATIFGKHVSLMDLAVSARQVGSGLVFLIFEHALLGHGIILQTVTPLEPLLQNVVHKIYCQKNVLAIIPKFIPRAECIQCDIIIWNNKQYLPKLLLVREDFSIQKYQRWYAQFYSEKSTRLPVLKEGLDW